VPSGLAHRRISAVVLVLVLYLTVTFYDTLIIWLGPDPTFEYLLLFCLAFFCGTVLLSPDLDLIDSDPAKSWGIVCFIWRPYARLFKHRGVSHMPVVGTLTRIVYLSLILYVLGTVAESLLGLTLPISMLDLHHFWVPETACVLAGLVGADMIHLVADRFFSP
jgi:uncharacterized metal-binding protein